MSVYHFVFVHPGNPVDELLAEISAAFGATLKSTDNPDTDFVATRDGVGMEVVLSHEYDEDRGMLFDRYDSVLEIRGPQRDLGRQEFAAVAVFESLKARGKYWLALVYDLQRVVKVADPDGNWNFPEAPST
jgi:hypothetical protein